MEERGGGSGRGAERPQEIRHRPVNKGGNMAVFFFYYTTNEQGVKSSLITPSTVLIISRLKTQ